jgi:hypothetical protein
MDTAAELAARAAERNCGLWLQMYDRPLKQESEDRVTVVSSAGS